MSMPTKNFEKKYHFDIWLNHYMYMVAKLGSVAIF